MSSFIHKSLSSALVGASLLAASMSAHAINVPLTLPTANLNANSTFTFSADSSEMLDALGIGVTGLGNAKAAAGGGLAFDMPVTEVAVTTSLLPFKITPVAGEAMGSALGFTRNNADGFILANFDLDFKRNVLMADFITTTGTTKAMDVFNFQIDQHLKVSMDGGLSLNMSLNDMYLTTGAQSKFASALKLESWAVAAMPMLEFGAIKVDIDPSLRFGLSDKAFTASMTTAVPEAPQVAMMMLGLIGLGFVSNRRNRRGA